VKKQNEKKGRGRLIIEKRRMSETRFSWNVPSSFQKCPSGTNNNTNGLSGAREARVVLLAFLMEPVDWVPRIMATIRVGDDQVRQLAVSDKLVLGRVLGNSVGCTRGVRIGAVVVPVANFDQVVTISLRIDGLCTGRVGMIFAAVSIPRTVGNKVVSAPGLEHTTRDLQVLRGTAVPRVRTSQVVVIVVLLAL